MKKAVCIALPEEVVAILSKLKDETGWTKSRIVADAITEFSKDYENATKI